MEATRGSAAPDTGTGNEHDPPAETVNHAPELSSFGQRVARRTERFGTDDTERESGGMTATASERSDMERGDDDDRRLASRRPSGSWVHRVADFAKWATQVTEAAAAEAAAASSSTDWRLERRRWKAAKPVPRAGNPVPAAAAADTHQETGAAERVSREAARLITSSPDAARQASEPSIQIGASERTVPPRQEAASE